MKPLGFRSSLTTYSSGLCFVGRSGRSCAGTSAIPALADAYRDRDRDETATWLEFRALLEREAERLRELVERVARMRSAIALAGSPWPDTTEPRSSWWPEVNEQPIDTVLFDLAEVYLTGLKGTNERLGRELGRPVPEALFLGEEAARIFHGEITEEEYWEALLAANDWGVGVEDLKRLARENFAAVEGTEAIVAELKAAGYRLGLLSIHAREWIEHCEREFDHHRHFDAVVYSYECGVSKPQPAAYERALEALGADPRRTLFIDDEPAYVRAAEGLGMRAIRFESAVQLRARLAELHLLPTRRDR